MSGKQGPCVGHSHTIPSEVRRGRQTQDRAQQLAQMSDNDRVTALAWTGYGGQACWLLKDVYPIDTAGFDLNDYY